MIATDENALICDFAETYHIYNYRSLPVSLAAILCVGLRDDSRIKMKIAGSKVPFSTLILGMISDQLGHLIWSMSEDGRRGQNRPQRIIDILYDADNKPSASDILTFDTPESFEKTRQRIIEGR